MLQQMRVLAKSWVSSVFLFALAASFGVWGIADIFRGQGDTSVATVGDVKIDTTLLQRDFNNAKQRAMNQAGGVLPSNELRDIGNKALQQLIDSAATDQYAAKLGLVASNEQVKATIQEIPAFKGPLGTFDRNTFLERIATIGFTEEGFIQDTKSDIMRGQIIAAAANGIDAPPGFATAIFMFINEKRAVQYITLPPDAAGTIPPPDDTTLAAYTKSHADEFSTPEYRDVTYATIAPEDLIGGQTVSDEQLRQQYELNKDKYVVPEKRDVEQITFPDEASANAALAQINAGKTTFADLAASKGLKPSDIDQGEQTEASLGERGPAAFAAPQDGVTKPVKFIVGWVLMHVTKITPGSTKTFDDVKASLKQDALLKLAQIKISDVINAFTDARAGGDSIEQAAKKVGMHVVHVAAVDDKGLSPDGSKAQLPTEPEFLPQVFKTDVGEDEDPFAASDDRQFVIRVNGITPPKLKPLDAVRAQVTAKWTAEERTHRLAEKAKEIAAEATASHGLASAAAALHATVASAGPLSRNTPFGALDRNIVQQIFSTPPATAVYAPTTAGDTYTVALVTGVLHPPTPEGDPRFQQLVAQLSQFFSGDMASAVAQAARAKATVKINQQQVDQVIGSGS